MNELIITGILLAIGLLFMTAINIVENADLIREWILDALVYVIDKVIAAGRYIYGLIYDIGTAYCKFRAQRARRKHKHFPEAEDASYDLMRLFKTESVVTDTYNK